MSDTERFERLTEMVRARANEHGLAEGSFTWCEFTDFKIQWQRSLDFIRFRISDYLEGESDEFFDAIVDSSLRKMFGKFDTATEPKFPPCVIETLQSPEFCERHAGTFIERCIASGRISPAKHTTLDDYLKRLIDEGALHPMASTFRIRWTSECIPPGYSTVMRVIWLPDFLRDEENIGDDGYLHLICALGMALLRDIRHFGEAEWVSYFDENTPYLEGNEGLLEELGIEVRR